MNPTIELDAQSSDAALWQAFRSGGDREALALLLERYARDLTQVAMRVTRNRTDAEDAVQMAVEQVLCTTADRLAHVRDPRPWFMGVAMNCSRQLIKTETRLRARHQRAHEQVLQDSVEFEYHAENEEQQQLLALLDESLADLPAKYQETVMLHYIHGMPFKDVGAALGRSEEAVKKQAQRGIKKLRELLTKRGAPVATALLVSLLGQLSAAECPVLARIEELCMALRSGQPFAHGVPQFVSPGLQVKSFVCIVSVIVFAAAIAYYLWFQQLISQKTELQTGSNLEEVAQQVPPVPIKDPWRSLGFNDVINAEGILEQFREVHAGTQEALDPRVGGKPAEPVWTLQSRNDSHFLQLVLRKPIDSVHYECAFEFRVTKEAADRRLVALGVLMRTTERPAPRNILISNNDMRRSVANKGDWQKGHVVVREFQRDGASWSRLTARVNDEIMTDVEIGIPAGNLFTPIAVVGLTAEVKNLRLKLNPADF